MRRRFRPALPLLASMLAAGIAAAMVAGPAAAEPVAAEPAAGLGPWLRPVAGPVARPFRAPIIRYGAGHLGVDLVAAPGTPVRAAGAGTVVFAGIVAGARHVVVRHAGGLRTSYSFLAGVQVRVGEAVARGEVLGTTGGRGENHDGDVLHLGLRVGETYVDPMQLFAPPDLAAVVHLVPIAAEPGPAVGRLGAEARDLTRALRESPPALETGSPTRLDAVSRAAAAGVISVAAGRRSATGRPLYPR
jgi:murein DD-endopeptidase MepM/ murein hydrolase activator NlpD